jgi:hypothetical protein
MSAAVVRGIFLNPGDLLALVIRWKLAVDHLEELEMGSLPAEEALRFLIRHDFPVLLKEITELRPELV